MLNIFVAMYISIRQTENLTRPTSNFLTNLCSLHCDLGAIKINSTSALLWHQLISRKEFNAPSIVLLNSPYRKNCISIKSVTCLSIVKKSNPIVASRGRYPSTLYKNAYKKHSGRRKGKKRVVITHAPWGITALVSHLKFFEYILTIGYLKFLFNVSIAFIKRTQKTKF